MRQLVAKAQEGTLTDEERAALDNHELVNDLLGLLRSKPRRTLKHAGDDSTS